MSDINVTPMVDVMLVLLVIFMVTAPMLTVGVQVDLPQSKAKQLPGKEEVVSVSVNAKGEVVLQETIIDLEALKPKLEILLESRKRANKDDTIYVRADKTINYGRVLEVMGAINAAGFSKVALVSAQPQPKKKGER